MTRSQEKTSRALAFFLRHRANEFKVREDGYVSVALLLDTAEFKRKKLTLDDILRVTRGDLKRRFSMKEVNGTWYVRCNQGHSRGVNVTSEALLTERTKASFMCVHGSRKSLLEKIKSEGIKKMGRKHIHLVPDSNYTEWFCVKSGRKSTRDAFIFVDTGAAMRDGIRFFVSENGVILTEGDADGVLLPKYFLITETLE